LMVKTWRSWVVVKFVIFMGEVLMQEGIGSQAGRCQPAFHHLD
jgi:bacterioferritin-associated ferredoxin